MNKYIAKLIIDLDLPCTVEEFETFMNSITINTDDIGTITVYDIAEPYEGVIIDNPANSEVYYTLDVEGKKYLQNIVPYVQGYEPLTRENVMVVAQDHRAKVIDDFTATLKLNIAIDNFTPKTEEGQSL